MTPEDMLRPPAMKCEGCGAPIPPEVWGRVRSDVVAQGGNPNSLRVTTCAYCPAEGVAEGEARLLALAPGQRARRAREGPDGSLESRPA